MKFVLLIVICGLMVFGLLQMNQKESEKGPEYQVAWSDSPNLDISRALSENGIRNCGEYKHKAHRDYSREFLVFCSEDADI